MALNVENSHLSLKTGLEVWGRFPTQVLLHLFSQLASLGEMLTCNHTPVRTPGPFYYQVSKFPNLK